MDDMSRAFAVFARNGRPLADNGPVFVRRIIDRNGRVIEDHAHWSDPWLDGDSRIDRIAANMGVQPAPVIDPRTAFLTSKLLREVVTTGHSGPIRATKLVAAGKTGTSSRTSDVWFFGYTSRWMALAWLGDDKYERQLGYKDASFMLSVPMWARFMFQAVGDQPLQEIPWEVPAHVKSTDIGGPLKKGYPPPPPPGFDVDGKPIAPPDKLREQVKQQNDLLNANTVAVQPPKTLVPQKQIRVQGAPPKPLPGQGQREKGPALSPLPPGKPGTLQPAKPMNPAKTPQAKQTPPPKGNTPAWMQPHH
jgi:membrane carboxypeptidase/penicillin-binding protein